jgi:hypothetical protein
VIGGVYVGSGEMWSEARFEHDELSASVSWPVRNRSVLDIRCDLGSALRGSMATGWSFSPAMSATLDARP